MYYNCCCCCCCWRCVCCCKLLMWLLINASWNDIPKPKQIYEDVFTYTYIHIHLYIWLCVCVSVVKAYLWIMEGHKSGLSFISWNTHPKFHREKHRKILQPQQKMKWWWNMRIFLISNISYRFMSMSLVLSWTSLIFLSSLSLSFSVSMCVDFRTLMRIVWGLLGIICRRANGPMIYAFV